MSRTGFSDSSIVVTTAVGVMSPALGVGLTGVLHFVKGIPGAAGRRERREHRWRRRGPRSAPSPGGGPAWSGSAMSGGECAEVLSALRRGGSGEPADRGAATNTPALARVGSTAELAGMLPGCDILVLCSPLTPKTRGIIGRNEMGLLPERAIVVNIGAASSSMRRR